MLGPLPPADRLLVWCGNGHATKVAGPGWWEPMGFHFWRLAGEEPFVVDQTVTVAFPGSDPEWRERLVDEWRPVLEGLGGTAGVLATDAPGPLAGWPGVDAVVLSTDNSMT